MASSNADASPLDATIGGAVDRWLAPNERLLWAVVVVVFALDLVTTRLGLAIGLAESNPVAAALLAGYGFAALVVLKAGAFAVGAACRRIVPDRHGVAIPLGLALPSGTAAVSNALTITVAL